MLLASSGFITICPKKEVELGADRHLHRADHAEELKKEIEFDCPKATGNQYAYLPGGGVRAINPNSSMTLAETENLIAVFKGNLFNKAELARNVLGVHTPLGEAQLLLQLYAAKGLDMLGMLNGQFAFCLYDSKQARVLAARDHSGVVPLMEGRTAAGSLIIACGTFLPEGVTCMSDIKPGEYKYGWHALPRAFSRGETRIVSGRASCDYGIRRRSIDAYNAPQRRSTELQRHSSMDIPRQHSGHLPSPTSHSYGHTPGRYMPPHLAAAAAAAGGSAFSRQRATSFDGHNLQGGSSSSSSHYHHGTPPAAGGRRRSETNTHGSSSSRVQPHPAPASQHWAPKSPLAVATSAAPAAAATAVSKAANLPPPIQTTPAACLQADEVATPGSIASSTPSTASGSVDTPHRRKRRHHRRGRTTPSPNAASGAAAAAAVDETNDGQASEADSQVSSSTHDSANSGPAAAAATAGTAAAARQQGSGRKGGNKGAAAASKPAGKAAAQQKNKEPQQQQQRRSSSSGSGSGGGSSGGFKRNSSCGELAVLGSSPTAHARSVLMAAPQGLAC